MPQHSLASAQINDPGRCSSIHLGHSGPPSGQRLSSYVWLTTSRQSSQNLHALGHHLPLRLVTFPSSLDSDKAPEGWAMSPPLRLRASPLRPRFPGQGQIFRHSWVPEGWAVSPPSCSPSHRPLPFVT